MAEVAAFLNERYGEGTVTVTIKEQYRNMAFGDSMNDYAILRFVGHPRVMANACYTLRKCWPVVGSNADHAVQRALRDVLDGIL